MVDTGAIKSYIIINTLRGFSRDVWHAIFRKYKWRHTAACWDNTMDQLVPSALLATYHQMESYAITVRRTPLVVLLKRTAWCTFCKFLEALNVGLVEWK